MGECILCIKMDICVAMELLLTELQIKRDMKLKKCFFTSSSSLFELCAVHYVIVFSKKYIILLNTISFYCLYKWLHILDVFKINVFIYSIIKEKNQFENQFRGPFCVTIVSLKETNKKKSKRKAP